MEEFNWRPFITLGLVVLIVLIGLSFLPFLFGRGTWGPGMMWGPWMWGMGFFWVFPLFGFLVMLGFVFFFLRGMFGSGSPMGPMMGGPRSREYRHPTERATCPECGEPVQSDWLLCPYCGTDLK